MTDPRDRYNVRLETDEDAQRRSAGSVHHGGSFKKYMEGKNRKLREQFASEARAGQADSTADPSKNLLKGISIHVNGFTIPSHQASVAVQSRVETPSQKSLPVTAIFQFGSNDKLFASIIVRPSAQNFRAIAGIATSYGPIRRQI